MSKVSNAPETADPGQLSVLQAYFDVENFLNGRGKGKPLETKSAMIWGALWVVYKHGDVEWDDMIRMYGEYMSKTMGLR